MQSRGDDSPTAAIQLGPRQSRAGTNRKKAPARQLTRGLTIPRQPIDNGSYQPERQFQLVGDARGSDRLHTEGKPRRVAVIDRIAALAFAGSVVVMVTAVAMLIGLLFVTRLRG